MYEKSIICCLDNENFGEFRQRQVLEKAIDTSYFTPLMKL